MAELAERGVKTDRRAAWVFVRAEGLSFKKTVLPAEQTRADIARKRLRWKTHQHRIEARRPSSAGRKTDAFRPRRDRTMPRPQPRMERCSTTEAPVVG